MSIKSIKSIKSIETLQYLILFIYFYFLLLAYHEVNLQLQLKLYNTSYCKQ